MIGLGVKAIASLLTRAIGLNPTQDEYLCDTQIIVLSLGITLYSLLVRLFSLDTCEFAYISRFNNRKKWVVFFVILELVDIFTHYFILVPVVKRFAGRYNSAYTSWISYFMMILVVID